LEEELRKKWAFFLPMRWNLDWMIKWNNITKILKYLWNHSLVGFLLLASMWSPPLFLQGFRFKVGRLALMFTAYSTHGEVYVLSSESNFWCRLESEKKNLENRLGFFIFARRGIDESETATVAACRFGPST
jgi:hypothetical protein